MQTPRFLAIAGSLRSGSYNRRLLRAAMEDYPQVDWQLARLRPIPPYDADVEARGWPPPVQRLREQIEWSDGIVIGTPNYNRSIPGFLKNAIDWASRPAKASPLVGKPVLMIGASPGRGGAVRALEHLRLVLEDTGAEPLPEWVSVPLVRERFVGDEPDAALRREVCEALARLPVARVPEVAAAG